LLNRRRSAQQRNPASTGMESTAPFLKTPRENRQGCIPVHAFCLLFLCWKCVAVWLTWRTFSLSIICSRIVWHITYLSSIDIHVALLEALRNTKPLLENFGLGRPPSQWKSYVCDGWSHSEKLGSATLRSCYTWNHSPPPSPPPYLLFVYKVSSSWVGCRNSGLRRQNCNSHFVSLVFLKITFGARCDGAQAVEIVRVASLRLGFQFITERAN